MTDRITRLNTTQGDFDSALAKLLAWDDSVDHQVNESVRHILREVKTRGDAAVLEFTEQFDRLKAGSMAELGWTRAVFRRLWSGFPRISGWLLRKLLSGFGIIMSGRIRSPGSIRMKTGRFWGRR